MPDDVIIAGGKQAIRFFLPLTKRSNDDERMVYGYASTEAVDSEGDVITADAMRDALPNYMKFANIREMHNLSAVGTAKEAEVDETNGTWIGAHIVDDMAWKKVANRVYKGFSIGGNVTSRDPENKKIITGLDLIEISLVDRPSNPKALIETFKADHFMVPLEPPKKEAAVKPAAKKVITEADLEAKARELCVADKVDPDKIVAKGSHGMEMKAWQRYMKAAREALDAPAAKPVGAVATGTDDVPEGKAVEVAKVLEELDQEETVIEETEDQKAARASSEGIARMMVEENAKRLVALGVDDVKSLDDVCRKLGVKADMAQKVIDHITSDNFQGGAITIKEASTKKKAAPVVQPAKVEGQKAAGKPTTLNLDLGAEDDGDEPKQSARTKDYGSYEDAGYADRGYQDDGKQRFPLKKAGELDESRIRAAWGFITVKRNQAPYDDEDVSKIKKAISDAWKTKIDKDGPPAEVKVGAKTKSTNNKTEDTKVTKKVLEPFGKADTASSIQKGLYAAACAISLLEQLSWLQQNLAAEKAAEGDDSTVPDRFKELLGQMGSLVLELAEEEIDEMLGSEDTKDLISLAGIPLIIKAVAPWISKDAFVKGIRDRIADRTGDPGFQGLSDFADAIEKGDVAQTQDWGSRNGGQQVDNDDWGSRSINKADAQRIHDLSISGGATCIKKGEEERPTAKAKGKDGKGKDQQDDEDNADGGADEGAEGDDGKKKKKAAGPKGRDGELLTAIEKGFGDLTKALITQANSGRNPPKPGAATVLKSVAKGEDIHDIHPDAEEDDDADLTPEQKAQKVLKKQMGSPQFIRT